MVKIENYNYEISTNKNKKLMVQVKGKIIHFGQKNYQHYFDKTKLLDKKLNHMDKKRKESYLNRSKGIKDKNGKLTYNDITSANYHARKVLW